MLEKFYEQDDYESLEGKLLVASPHLDDLYFNKSLVYICAHDSSGAIGIIINQKIGTVSCADFLLGNTPDDKSTFFKKKIPLMFGGPINTDMLLALSTQKSNNKILIEDESVIVHTDIAGFLKKQKKAKTLNIKFILAKGVSAWDSQQLEEELANNDWFVVKPSLDLIFSQKRGDKWSKVMKDLGIANTRELVHYSGNA